MSPSSPARTGDYIYPFCPEWCEYPLGHDPGEAADGGRVHASPPIGRSGQFVTLADHEQLYDDQPMWGWHADFEDALVATPAGLAAVLRSHAADLALVADWLDAQ